MDKFIRIHRPDLPEVGEGLVSPRSFEKVYKPQGWVEVGSTPPKRKRRKKTPDVETTTEDEAPDTMTDET